LPNILTFFYTSDEDVVYFIELYENNVLRVMFDHLNTPFIDFEIFKAIKQLKTGPSDGPNALQFFFIHGKTHSFAIFSIIIQ
jgi:hypothetical protein